MLKVVPPRLVFNLRINTTMNYSLDRPNIFKFHSLYGFITTMLSWRRISDVDFNIAKFVRECGSCSRSLVYGVVKGECSLTLDHTEVFCKLLALDSKEKRYFEKWVKLSRSQSDVDPRLSKLVPKQLPERMPSNDLRSNWLHSYVLESVNHRNFEEDPEVIAKILGGIASIERVKRSLKFLIKEGFLKRDNLGKLVCDEEVFTSTRHISDEAVRKCTLKTLDLAKDAIKKQPIEDRNTSSFLFVATKERAKKYRALVDEFMDQVQELYHEEPDGDEEIYHMIMHFSPVVGRKHV